MDRVLDVANRVIPAFRSIGGLAFAYGQGSLVAGFAEDADLDLLVVWDKEEPPRYRIPTVESLHDGAAKPVRFDFPGYARDRFTVGGMEIDVAHKSLGVFDGWLQEIQNGWGWEDTAYPLPLYAVAGFAYGLVVADDNGRAASAREELAAFPEVLIERTRLVLGAEMPSYDRDLADCVRRGDGWLFHEQLSKVLRHAMVAWFAAEHRYCPYPKWLSRWVTRFGLDPAIAGLERSMWAPATLDRRLELFLTMVHRILTMTPRDSGRGGLT